MKIRRFKLAPRMREVYAALKRTGVTLTPDIEAMATVADRRLADLLDPAVVCETADGASALMAEVKRIQQVPRNVTAVSFVCATLGSAVDAAVRDDDELQRLILEALLMEYLDAAGRFVYKLLQDQAEADTELGSMNALPAELAPAADELLQPARIGVTRMAGVLSPRFSAMHYVYWFARRK